MDIINLICADIIMVDISLPAHDDGVLAGAAPLGPTEHVH